jgi:hypothetical protein
MKAGKYELSVEEKIRTALHMMRSEGLESKITVAKLCRLAGVNRSNLYVSHPDIVREIRLLTPKPERPERSDLPARVQTEKTVSKALLYLCLELQAELDFTKARMTGGGKNRLK